MIDPTNRELEAIEYGGRMGGEYLDEIKKTDVGSLSKKEWDAFIGCVIAGYLHKMAEIPY